MKKSSDEYTMIRVYKKTTELLKKKKEHPRETYEDVILRAIGEKRRVLP